MSGERTLIEILTIQSEQLQEWKVKLNDQCFKALQRKCQYENGFLKEDTDPYKVFRGTDLNNFICNWEGNFILIMVTSTGVGYYSNEGHITTEIKNAKIFHKTYQAEDRIKREGLDTNNWNVTTIKL